jgi:hypothetical protein
MSDTAILNKASEHFKQDKNTRVERAFRSSRRRVAPWTPDGSVLMRDLEAATTARHQKEQALQVRKQARHILKRIKDQEIQKRKETREAYQKEGFSTDEEGRKQKLSWEDWMLSSGRALGHEEYLPRNRERFQ